MNSYSPARVRTTHRNCRSPPGPIPAPIHMVPSCRTSRSHLGCSHRAIPAPSLHPSFVISNKNPGVSARYIPTNWYPPLLAHFHPVFAIFTIGMVWWLYVGLPHLDHLTRKQHTAYRTLGCFTFHLLVALQVVVVRVSRKLSHPCELVSASLPCIVLLS